jgi:hypothetical protein
LAPAWSSITNWPSPVLPWIRTISPGYAATVIRAVALPFGPLGVHTIGSFHTASPESVLAPRM